MSKTFANVNVTTDTWGSLITKLNELRFLDQTETVTANATLGVTVGNARLDGQFTANGVLAVTTSVRGGNVSISNTLVISSGASVGANLVVTGNISCNVSTQNVVVTPSINSTGTGIVYQGKVLVDIASNTGIGAGASLMVYRFPKASYSSGEFLVQAKNGGTTQTSKIIMATDGGTNASLVLFGTVAVPPGANGSPLGTYTSNVNGANVELVFLQAVSNTAMTIKAELLV